MKINESSNAEYELESNGYGSDESEDIGFDAISGDTVLFTTLEEAALSKICKKEQAVVKNVNQA